MPKIYDTKNETDLINEKTFDIPPHPGFKKKEEKKKKRGILFFLLLLGLIGGFFLLRWFNRQPVPQPEPVPAAVETPAPVPAPEPAPAPVVEKIEEPAPAPVETPAPAPAPVVQKKGFYLNLFPVFIKVNETLGILVPFYIHWHQEGASTRSYWSILYYRLVQKNQISTGVFPFYEKELELENGQVTGYKHRVFMIPVSEGKN